MVEPVVLPDGKDGEAWGNGGGEYGIKGLSGPVMRGDENVRAERSGNLRRFFKPLSLHISRE